MKAFRRLAFVLFPLLPMAAAMPIITEVLPPEVQSGVYHLDFWLIGSAFLGGLIASPGYLFVVFSDQPRRLGRLGDVWICISLNLGAFASLIGAKFMLLLFWPAVVFPGGTVLICMWLLYNYVFRENADKTERYTAR